MSALLLIPAAACKASPDRMSTLGWVAFFAGLALMMQVAIAPTAYFVYRDRKRDRLRDGQRRDLRTVYREPQ
jgi:hypothetical protein